MRDKKTEVFILRLTAKEKVAFRKIANVNGIPLSNWVLARLRLAAMHELKAVGEPVDFLTEAEP